MEGQASFKPGWPRFKPGWPTLKPGHPRVLSCTSGQTRATSFILGQPSLKPRANHSSSGRVFKTCWSSFNLCQTRLSRFKLVSVFVYVCVCVCVCVCACVLDSQVLQSCLCVSQHACYMHPWSLSLQSTVLYIRWVGSYRSRCHACRYKLLATLLPILNLNPWMCNIICFEVMNEKLFRNIKYGGL